MSAIEVKDLSKKYKVKEVESGTLKRLGSLFHQKYREVEAVKNISFNVDEGEMLAFIGPNGAGKSTTIKMMTGIMTPSTGELSVLGYNPANQRRKLAYSIGSVFGQKAQLWYHLPPNDTFSLLGKIYEMDPAVCRKQMNYLIDLFDLSGFMSTPVRKLSLGQRMKCEIAASLLHNPKLVFLDEPTIGLDIIAKDQIRKALIEMNHDYGTTVFLTSHDPSDIEMLCNRVIVVNHGTIMLDQSMDEIRNGYMSERVLKVAFNTEVEGEIILDDLSDRVSVTMENKYSAELRFDSRDLQVGSLTYQLMKNSSNIADIVVQIPSMEDVIRKIYEEQSRNGGKR